MPREPDHIFLEPGFFGFTNLGQLRYFAHVKEFLQTACTERGLRVEVHAAATEPTASIRRRAASLLAAIDAAGGRGPIHLVGHSTGGLDARLLVTPGVDLTTAIAVEPVARRVRTVVSVATPHHGTPAAAFFNTLAGQRVLRLLSLATIYGLRFGRLPLSVLLRLGALLTRLDDLLGWRETIADQIYDQLLGEFSADRRAAVGAFVEQASRDQALMAQITPEGIDMFNAAATDRPGVRYGAVIAVAPRPGLRTALSAIRDPYAALSYGLFAALSRIATGGVALPAQTPTPAQLVQLDEPLGRPLAPADNDGLVPALSQLRGELIHAARADHLDVIGHFGEPRPGHDPPHYDWFASGSGFSRTAFERLWRAVAAFVAGA